MVNILFESWSTTSCLINSRGDTISESCKKIGKKFKLDLRLVLTPEEDIDLDSCTREMAKRATVKKIYKDKLKSTIATKCRLNSFVRAVPHIQARELPSVKMPILQVAGFQGQLSFIYLSKKKKKRIHATRGCLLFVSTISQANQRWCYWKPDRLFGRYWGKMTDKATVSCIITHSFSCILRNGG